MNEAYVSFEVAKLLKEKGFSIPSDTSYKDYLWQMYDENGNVHWGMYNNDWYFRITQQMACRWLREEKNLNIDVSWDNVLNWFFQVVSLTETVQLDYEEPRVFHSSNETGFKTYEDAVEAALKYCLTNII